MIKAHFSQSGITFAFNSLVSKHPLGFLENRFEVFMTSVSQNETQNCATPTQINSPHLVVELNLITGSKESLFVRKS